MGLLLLLFYLFLVIRSRLCLVKLIPPSEMVVLAIYLSNYSSFLMAKRICLGIILVLQLSLAALPANSKNSAAKYSNTAARQTGAPVPTLSVYLPYLKNLLILPTGNYNPALDDLETYFFDDDDFPFPFPAILNI